MDIIVLIIMFQRSNINAYDLFPCFFICLNWEVHEKSSNWIL